MQTLLKSEINMADGSQTYPLKQALTIVLKSKMPYPADNHIRDATFSTFVLNARPATPHFEALKRT